MQAPQIKTTLVNSNAVKVEFTNFQFDDSNPINITEKDEANNLVSDLIVNEDKPIINKHEYQIINSQNNQFPIMSVIGQFHGNYILAEGIDGLYIIDQHAAQERYNFEKFQHLLLSEKVEYQTLLIPLIVEVGNFIQTAFDEIAEMMIKVNVTVERFGSDSILCRSIPTWMSDIDVSAFIMDMIDYYQENKDISILSIRKAALASLACHVSLKFNQHLTLAEMKEVIISLQRCENPFNCPHGRPTFIKISESQLKKEFLR